MVRVRDRRYTKGVLDFLDPETPLRDNDPRKKEIQKLLDSLAPKCRSLDSCPMVNGQIKCVKNKDFSYDACLPQWSKSALGLLATDALFMAAGAKEGQGKVLAESGLGQSLIQQNPDLWSKTMDEMGLGDAHVFPQPDKGSWGYYSEAFTKNRYRCGMDFDCYRRIEYIEYEIMRQVNANPPTTGGSYFRIEWPPTITADGQIVFRFIQ